MPAAPVAHAADEGGREGPGAAGRPRLAPPAREALVFLGFVALTALMTWPWALNLRDAVADPGDPYMIAWSLWWDYHQTFRDPLRLFHANVFYPYRYTLAFSENDYGIALLFFPAFAAGARPLTVHSVATFLGFAFSGYGMFRLSRTLTGSAAAGWVSGVAFAFVPYRFHVLAHLHYLFAGWLPLVAEALVLFMRRRSWGRAAWLGAAFLMNALTCLTWFIMALIPLGLTAAALAARGPRVLRERAFWLRAGVSLGVASLLLLPFLLPYYWVSEMYGLRWQPWEFAHNSPTLAHWASAASPNKLWAGMGAHLEGGHPLFPGLLTPLLALAALRLKFRVAGSGVRVKDEAEPRAAGGTSDVKADARAAARGQVGGPPSTRGSKLATRNFVAVALEALIVLVAVVGVLAVGYKDVRLAVGGVQLLRTGGETPRLALVVIVALLAARLALAARSGRGRVRGGGGAGWPEALVVGLVWAGWGFVSSLGANFFLNLWLHEHVLLFQSLRFPSRWAMVCYVGLSLLAGAGAAAVAGRLRVKDGAEPRGAAGGPTLTELNPRATAHVSGSKLETRNLLFFALVCAALLAELRAFPLRFVRGEVEPDAVTLRLKQTPMRGGLVELPSEAGAARHRYMLRAADHGRPLVNATASFISPLTDQINRATRDGALRPPFLDLLEAIPASYLVIHNAALGPEQRAGYEAFLAGAVASGRLRFVNRFDGRDDLYAVVKTEPGARAEAPLPFTVDERDWTTLLEDDTAHLVGAYLPLSRKLFLLHLAATGRMPRYEEFMRDAREVGRGLVPGRGEWDKPERRFREFVAERARRPDFREAHARLDDEQYVALLFERAG
ncbi:MAG TPA: hypothetical protein VN228_09755, partial [Pyrinomonadaceae bacterium]|nr:hypothetical protein [Pyrinomonadaceae bacterium]